MRWTADLVARWLELESFDDRRKRIHRELDQVNKKMLMFSDFPNECERQTGRTTHMICDILASLLNSEEVHAYVVVHYAAMQDIVQEKLKEYLERMPKEVQKKQLLERVAIATKFDVRQANMMSHTHVFSDMNVGWKTYSPVN